MNLLENKFIRVSERNIEHVISLLEQTRDHVLAISPWRHDMDDPVWCKFTRTNNVNYEIMAYEKARKMYGFGFNYFQIPELLWWRRWMTNKCDLAREIDFYLPEDLPIMGSQKNTEYCLNVLKEFPPKYCLVWDINKCFRGVWHVYDVESAEEHGVELDCISYLGIMHSIKEANVSI